MANQYEQISLLPAEPAEEDNCVHCRFFAELKEPFERSDGAVIYGYCFSAGDQDYSPGMGKGYAVFIPYGRCKAFKPRKKCRASGKTRLHVRSRRDSSHLAAPPIQCCGMRKEYQKMFDFDKYANHGKCEVCGKESDVVARMSSIGPMIFSCCRACLAADAEPYERMVSYTACAGEWPKDIGSAHQVEIRRLLGFHGKTEEQFAQDVSYFRANKALPDNRRS